LYFTGEGGDNKIHKRANSGHVRAGWEAKKRQSNLERFALPLTLEEGINCTAAEWH